MMPTSREATRWSTCKQTLFGYRGRNAIGWFLPEWYSADRPYHVDALRQQRDVHLGAARADGELVVALHEALPVVALPIAGRPGRAVPCNRPRVCAEPARAHTGRPGLGGDLDDRTHRAPDRRTGPGRGSGAARSSWPCSAWSAHSHSGGPGAGPRRHGGIQRGAGGRGAGSGSGTGSDSSQGGGATAAQYQHG